MTALAPLTLLCFHLHLPTHLLGLHLPSDVVKTKSLKIKTRPRPRQSMSKTKTCKFGSQDVSRLKCKF